MTSYEEDWKEANPYNSRRYWTGPNDLFTVPTTEQTNKVSYAHDTVYSKYENPHFGSVPEDWDWIEQANPLDPAYWIGAPFFALKSMLPRAKLKEAQKEMSEPPRKRSKSYRSVLRAPRHMRDDPQPVTPAPRTNPDADHAFQLARERAFRGAISRAWHAARFQRYGAIHSASGYGSVVQQLQDRNVRAPVRGLGAQNVRVHKLNGRRMARTKRKFSRSKRSRRSHRKRFKGRSGGRKFGRRRFKSSIKRVYRKIRKLAGRINRAGLLSPRYVSKQLAGGSVGAVNRWMYRVVDNMFFFTDAQPANFNYDLAWNGYNLFATAIGAVYGNVPLASDTYHFTYREMSTMFQSPTNTPTFVEVYLLKPKKYVALDEDSTTHPLILADQGTTANTVYNEGSEDPYTFTQGASPAQIINGYGTSAIYYNPFTDRNNMKDRFKVKKVWKFTLGPQSSKVITLKSKKKFVFRPTLYGGFVGHADEAGSAMSSVNNPNVSNGRIMVVRWHGSNQGATADADVYQGTRLKAGLTGDPLIVRRWIKFGLYKMDVPYMQHSFFDSTENVVATTDYAKLKVYGFDSLAATQASQPTPAT